VKDVAPCPFPTANVAISYISHVKIGQAWIQESGLLPQRLGAMKAPQNEIHQKEGKTRHALRFGAPLQDEGCL
jgi:hypothetical protein